MIQAVDSIILLVWIYITKVKVRGKTDKTLWR